MHQLVHAANFNNYNIPQRRNKSTQTIYSNATNIKAVGSTVFYVYVSSNILLHIHSTYEPTIVAQRGRYTPLTRKAYHRA